VPPDRADEAIRMLRDRGETASLIGEVRKGAAGVVIHE
jgi:hydrogenase maturation factor